MTDSLRDNCRGVSPVVGKSLAAGLTLLYVASMTGLLIGSTVPAYESAAGDELADRVLSTAASEIEDTVSASGEAVTVRTTVDMPPTIENTGYRLVVSGETLKLEHPDEAIGGEIQLSLPPDVTVEDGTWQSHSELVLRMSGTTGDRTLRMGDAG